CIYKSGISYPAGYIYRNILRCQSFTTLHFALVAARKLSPLDFKWAPPADPDSTRGVVSFLYAHLRYERSIYSDRTNAKLLRSVTPSALWEREDGENTIAILRANGETPFTVCVGKRCFAGVNFANEFVSIERWYTRQTCVGGVSRGAHAPPYLDLCCVRTSVRFPFKRRIALDKVYFHIFPFGSGRGYANTPRLVGDKGGSVGRSIADPEDNLVRLLPHVHAVRRPIELNRCRRI